MNQRRRLRRVIEKAELTPIAMNAAPHGCEHCRGEAWRGSLMRELLGNRMIGDSKVLCALCGAKWLVSLFAAPPTNELLISFKPIVDESLN